MRAIVVTITKDPWPARMSRHWHLVDSFLSRHVVGSVYAIYGPLAVIEELEWEDGMPRPVCTQCGDPI